MDLVHPNPWARRVPFATLLGTAMAVACAPAQPAPPPAAPAAAPAPAAPAVQVVPGTDKDAWYLDPWSLGYEKPTSTGGTFSYANNNGALNLDPWGNNTRARAFFDTAYDALVARRLTPGVSPLAADVICRLCTTWEVKGDLKTIVFKLRQNTKFHDGQQFTAEDVKFSLEKAADAKTGFEFRGLLASLDRVEVVDKNTVTLVSKVPDADLLRVLNLFPIAPKHVFDAGGDLTKQVIGTGPFKMEKFEVDQQYVAVKNGDFWLPDRPILDRIVAFYIAEKSQRQAAFLSKQIDNYTAGDINEMRPVEAAVRTAKVENIGGNLVQVLYVNVNKKPFSDKRVRQAMHLALDRDQMNKQLTAGLGVPYMLPGTPSGWQAHTIKQEELARLPGFRQPKDQDIAEGKRLLAEAGYPNGFKTSSKHIASYTSNPEWNEAASGQLQKIGVEVTLDPVEVGVGLQQYAECNFDMFVRVSGGGESYLTRNYRRWTTGGAENICKYSNPEYDRLVDQQAADFDVAKRWEIAKKIQQILLDELPAIPLPEAAQFAAWHPTLHNWRNYGHSFSMPWYPTAELVWVQK